MGIAGKADTAQIIKIIEFPLHVMTGSLMRAADDAIKKLPHHTRPTAQFLVNVNMVGCLNAKHLEVGGDAADTDLREDVIVQISIEGILLGKTSKIYHKSAIGSLNILLGKHLFWTRIAWRKKSCLAIQMACG